MLVTSVTMWRVSIHTCMIFFDKLIKLVAVSMFVTIIAMWWIGRLRRQWIVIGVRSEWRRDVGSIVSVVV